jgi:hypothetical protein
VRRVVLKGRVLKGRASKRRSWMWKRRMLPRL